MYPQSAKHRFFKTSLLIAWLSLGTTNAVMALESDKYQPIDVSADSAVLDDKAGKALYRGNVLLTQGTLKIIAEQLTIQAGSEGKVEKVIATGDQAQFEQTPNENDKPIEAQANTIEYFVANEKIILIENARVVQNDNLFEGNIIEYDIREEKLQAHGQALNGDSEDGTGRVKMILQPQTAPATPNDKTPPSNSENATTDANPTDQSPAKNP